MAVAAVTGRGCLGGVENLLWHASEPIAARLPGQGVAEASRRDARDERAGMNTFGILGVSAFSRTATFV